MDRRAAGRREEGPTEKRVVVKTRPSLLQQALPSRATVSRISLPRCPAGPIGKTPILCRAPPMSMAPVCVSMLTSPSSSEGLARKVAAAALSHHSSTLPSPTTPPRPTIRRCAPEMAPRRRTEVLPPFALTCLSPLLRPSLRAVSLISSPIRAVVVVTEAIRTTHPECIG